VGWIRRGDEAEGDGSIEGGAGGGVDNGDDEDGCKPCESLSRWWDDESREGFRWAVESMVDKRADDYWGIRMPIGNVIGYVGS
jgi:hypothetical protein